MPRPKLTCHMITTLDGRLRTGRWPYSEAELLETYDAIAARLGGEGWIVGRTSMAGYVPQGAPALAPEAMPRADLLAERAGRAVAVVFDRTGRLLPESGTVGGDHLVIVLSTRVAQDHVEQLHARGVSVAFSGPEGADLDAALTRIAEGFGLSHLLLEGGGTLNGAFLAAGLIDATSTLILPAIDGERGSPAIYERAAAPAQRLELTHAETLEGGVVWLRHQVVRS